MKLHEKAVEHARSRRKGHEHERQRKMAEGETNMNGTKHETLYKIVEKQFSLILALQVFLIAFCILNTSTIFSFTFWHPHSNKMKVGGILAF